MGQKIHPTGFRLAVSRNWASRWYASNRDFAGMLAEDIKVREYLKAKLKNASVSRVLIERPASMPAKSRLLAYQREAQLRLIAKRKPVGWIFCPICLQAFQLPTVTYTWHVGLLMLLPRPLARAVKRLSVAPCST